MTPLTDLRAAIDAASADLRGEARARPTLERPKKAEFGDYSTNAAMLLAPALRSSPREVAARLGEAVSARLGDRLERVDVAGPGFLNLFLADVWYADALAGVLEAGAAWGAGGAAPSESINVEFVSANPTGPVHIGGTRNAAYGDAISRILDFHGHRVHREYYVNDAGTQARLFGESIRARARGEEVPEGGYQGDYVGSLAAELPGAADLPVEELAERGIAMMLDRVRASLERFRIHMDTWFSESSLYPDAVEHALETLREQGAIYESEGAVWMRTTDFGDDKDRVLVRSNGEHTYFASDCAYHLSKRERGFERLIDVWGADHHGYVKRVKAAYGGLGQDPDNLELVIMQFVHLVEGGGRAKMSKRAGEFVALDDLLDEIGVDAARWFLLARSHDTEIELDLDLAKRQTNENPVYYVQYAHARIASILAKTDVEPVAEPSGPLEPAERTLVKFLLDFPAEVAEAADRRAPHRIATYALEAARAYARFYEQCQVIGSDAEPFRLALSVATQRTIARSLDLLGIDAPQSM